MSPAPAPRIQLGYVAGAHGVRGAVRVKLFNADSKGLQSGLAPGAVVHLCPRGDVGQDTRALEILRVAPKPGSDLCRIWFAGVTGRDAADALRSHEVWIERAQLPALDDDEFYFADLIGFDVVRVADEDARESLGQVTGVTTNTAQTLLCVRRDGREWLLPALAPFMVDIAMDRRQVVVDVHDEMLPEPR